MAQYRLRPSDKVLRSFFFNEAYLSCIMGPVGGGKTLASLQRFARFAIRQAPHPRDNVRRTRWVSIRDTYRNLERTTLKTWHAWWPKSKDNWRGGANGEPGIGHYIWQLPDETIVDMEVIFAAVGEQDIEEFAGGFEVTGFHVGEGSTLPEDIYLKMLERVGRYPRVDEPAGFTGATYSAGWIDCNAPNYGNHIETNFMKELKPGYAFFRQPGGLDPDAENLHNLPGGRKYYIRIAQTTSESNKRRMVDNLLGHDRSGKPVYKDYNPFKHLSKLPLKPLRGCKLYCGLDQGRSPAAVFMQRSQAGQLRILSEIAVTNVGATEFAGLLRQHIDERYPDFDIIFVADPAAWQPNELSEDAEDIWVIRVENAADIEIKPAFSNRRSAREAALEQHMRLSLSADVEALIVDPSCVMVNEGFTQHFRFRRVSASGQPERYADKVEKNDWSHPCEAAEYAAMEACGQRLVYGRANKPIPKDDAREEHWRPAGF